MNQGVAVKTKMHAGQDERRQEVDIGNQIIAIDQGIERNSYLDRLRYNEFAKHSERLAKTLWFQQPELLS